MHTHVPRAHLPRIISHTHTQTPKKSRRGSSSIFFSPIMASASFARDVKEIHNFLLVHAGAASEEAHIEVRNAQCKQLILKMDNYSMSMDEATQALEAIKEGPWTPEQKKEIQSAVAKAATVGARFTSQRTQTLLEPENYLTRSLWNLLDSPRFTESSKLHSYCMFLNKLGLTNPSERTVQNCTAKFWLAVRGADVFQLDGGSMIALSQNFKKMLMSFPRVSTSLTTYPSQPLFLRDVSPEVYVSAYEGEDAAPNQLDHIDVVRLVKVWPCRSSNKFVARASSSSIVPSAGDPMKRMQEMLVATIQNVFQPMLSAGTQAPPQPNIQYLRGGGGPGSSSLLRKASEVASAGEAQDGNPFKRGRTLGVEESIVPTHQEALPAPVPAASEAEAPPQPRAGALALRAPSPQPGTAAPRVATAHDIDLVEADMVKAVAERDRTRKEGQGAMKKPAGKVVPEVLGVPAAAAVPAVLGVRPKTPSLKSPASPVYYLGGRIYEDRKNQRLRCYRQIEDKVEKTMSYKKRPREDCYEEAFKAIEMDPRVCARQIEDKDESIE